MRAARIKPVKQYQLIMECRKSGLTDYQWCHEHNINPGTFYNWIKKFRQNGCADIPKSTYSRTDNVPAKQEVVRIDFSSSKTSIVEQQNIRMETVSDSAIEIPFGNTVIRIHNDINSTLLQQTLMMVKELSC